MVVFNDFNEEYYRSQFAEPSNGTALFLEISDDIVPPQKGKKGKKGKKGGRGRVFFEEIRAAALTARNNNRSWISFDMSIGGKGRAVERHFVFVRDNAFDSRNCTISTFVFVRFFRNSLPQNRIVSCADLRESYADNIIQYA